MEKTGKLVKKMEEDFTKKIEESNKNLIKFEEKEL